MPALFLGKVILANYNFGIKNYLQLLQCAKYPLTMINMNTICMLSSPLFLCLFAIYNNLQFSKNMLRNNPLKNNAIINIHLFIY